MRLGGIGEYVRRRDRGDDRQGIALRRPRPLQRGGSPNAFDRMLGTNFGACAVRALANGETGKMVALQAGTIVTVPLDRSMRNHQDGADRWPARPHRPRHRHFVRRTGEDPINSVGRSGRQKGLRTRTDTAIRLKIMEAVKKKLKDELERSKKSCTSNCRRRYRRRANSATFAKMPSTRPRWSASRSSRPASSGAAADWEVESIDISKIPTDSVAYGSKSCFTTSKRKKSTYGSSPRKKAIRKTA